MHEITTRFVKQLPEESGVSKSGTTWVKGGFLTTSDGQYPVNIAFSVWGDKTDLVKNLVTGNEIKVKFDVSSREYNGKYYHEIKAFAIEKVGQQTTQPAAFEQPQASRTAPAQFDAAPINDPLPF